MKNTAQQPALRAVPTTLFPTFDSLEEVMNFAYSKLPLVNRNEMTGILLIYQNTLLNQLGVSTH